MKVVNIQDKYNNSLLCYAMHNEEMIKVLLQCDTGTELNVQNTLGQTCLMLACKNGYIDTVRILVSYGANLYIEDNGGNNVLYYSLQYVNILTLLLQFGNFDINKQNKNGQTCLMLACKNGYLDAVKTLISHKVNIHIEDNDENNALYYSLQHSKIFMELLSYGKFNMNKQNRYGQTYLMIACSKNYTFVVNILFSYKVNLYIEDKCGNNVLYYSIQHTNIFTTLLKHGNFDINKQNKNGQTCLMVACNKCYEDTVDILLSRDVNLYIKDNHNNNVLFYAFDNIRIFKTILNSAPNFDLNLENNKGETILTYAFKLGVDGIIRSLLYYAYKHETILCIDDLRSISIENKKDHVLKILNEFTFEEYSDS